MPLLPQIAKTILKIDSVTIPSERREILQPLVDYIREKVIKGSPVRLNFICTHNSRRSHLAQVWAQVMACHFGIDRVFCYSGGTESTALYPMVVETLRHSGFQIETLSGLQNPVYVIKFSANEPPIIGFSKVWDAHFNPQSKFAAVMTCAQADEACPYIAGAEARIPVTYEDPKHFDKSPLQAEKYAEKSLQIASEMHHVLSKIGEEFGKRN